MIRDLSLDHKPVSSFLSPLDADVDAFQLTNQQLAFFHQHGYLSGIRILNDKQVATLCKELAEFTDSSHPGHELFYEYHSNESADPATVLFHALGAWRISPGFHDLLWNPV